VLLADRIAVRDVLEHKSRAPIIAREADMDPAGRAAELPRHIERLGRIAAGDGPAGVALELIPAAELEIALDGEKPASQTLRGRERIPQILDRRVVGPGRDRHERGLAEVLAILDPAELGAKSVRHLQVSFAGRPVLTVATNISNR
jgi:hypothetical protein